MQNSRRSATLAQRLMAALLLGGPAPQVHRERSYQSLTAQQSKAIARRRAANKRAAASRRVNRGRS